MKRNGRSQSSVHDRVRSDDSGLQGARGAYRAVVDTYFSINSVTRVASKGTDIKINITSLCSYYVTRTMYKSVMRISKINS
jgi:hypothetical protein